MAYVPAPNEKDLYKICLGIRSLASDVLAISVTPAALTKTDDTNVTATLGGTPATALLQATSITLGWTGTLAVARGGTGGGAASGTLLDNITGFSDTGYLSRTGAGTYSFLIVGNPKVYSGANFTLPTNYEHFVRTTLTLAGTAQAALQGTGELIVYDPESRSVKGVPKFGSFTVPLGYVCDVIGRVTLATQQRATLQGTGNLAMSDDFGTRSRITLAGIG